MGRVEKVIDGNGLMVEVGNEGGRIGKMVSDVERRVGDMEIDSGCYLSSDEGFGGNVVRALNDRERKKRKRVGSLMSVNRPITKTDFSTPQLCVNRKVGGMRRTWSFLSLSQGEDASGNSPEPLTLKASSPMKIWKKDLRGRGGDMVFDPLLSAQESL